MKKLMMVLAIAAAYFPVSAATWTVSMTSPDGQGFVGVHALTNALSRAGWGDVIVIGPGVYDLTELTPNLVNNYAYCYLTAFNSEGALPRQVRLTLKGANSKHWSEKSAEEETILRGGDDASIIFMYGASARDSSYVNLTFEHGRRVKRDKSGTIGGGAITLVGDAAGNIEEMRGVVSNCVFRGCSSAFAGGATLGPDVYDSMFTNCTSDVSGGAVCGIASADGAHTNVFERCVFMDCVAPTGGAIIGQKIDILRHCEFIGCKATSGAGGAVAAESSISALSGCVFTNCTASGQGGAVYCRYGIDRIEDCTFVDNSSPKSIGGAVSCSGIGTLIGCQFRCNRTTPGSGSGGAVYVETGVRTSVARIANCAFSGNEAGYAGGAVYSKVGINAFDGCVVQSNYAKNAGGGVWCSTEVTALSLSCFSNNVADVRAGGIGAGRFSSVDRCIFSGNKAGESSGGVHLASLSGSFTGCTFHSNTNNETKFGAHVNNALKMSRCTFTGYGDVVARDYECCVFSNCVYRYFEPTYGADAHALISYPNAVGNGTIRNCLVHGCKVSRILATEGVRTDVANCTFADNVLDGQFAIMFFAFRGGNPVRASTNVMVNCIFADNHVNGNPIVGSNPCDAFFQGSASPAGHTIVSNSIYRNASSVVFYGGTHETDSFRQGEPRFVGNSVRYLGAPKYMIRRSSAAIGAGILCTWMSGARDLGGCAMPVEGAVDIGCYQSNLPAKGLVFAVR